MTKEEFKIRWESNDEGGEITLDDIADCAKEWGLYPHPCCHPIDEVIKRVLTCAGVHEQDHS